MAIGSSFSRSPPKGKPMQMVLGYIKTQGKYHGSTPKDVIGYLMSVHDMTESQARKATALSLKRGIEFGILNKKRNLFTLQNCAIPLKDRHVERNCGRCMKHGIISLRRGGGRRRRSRRGRGRGRSRRGKGRGRRRSRRRRGRRSRGRGRSRRGRRGRRSRGRGRSRRGRRGRRRGRRSRGRGRRHGGDTDDPKLSGGSRRRKSSATRNETNPASNEADPSLTLKSSRGFKKGSNHICTYR